MHQLICVYRSKLKLKLNKLLSVTHINVLLFGFVLIIVMTCITLLLLATLCALAHTKTNWMVTSMMIGASTYLCKIHLIDVL